MRSYGNIRTIHTLTDTRQAERNRRLMTHEQTSSSNRKGDRMLTKGSSSFHSNETKERIVMSDVTLTFIYSGRKRFKSIGSCERIRDKDGELQSVGSVKQLKTEEQLRQEEQRICVDLKRREQNFYATILHQTKQIRDSLKSDNRANGTKW